MALVIAVAQRKGGAGKSTVAANLAVAFAAEGARVALLDTDPQKTLRHWWDARAQAEPTPATPGLRFEDPSGWRVPGMVDALRRDHAVVILDTPPHDDTDARVAIRAAGVVLVPLQPSPADLWAMEATLALAASERRPVRLLLNRVPPQGRLLQEVVAGLAARALPVLGTRLGNRVAFAAAFAEGLGVTELDPRSAASDEMRALAAEMRG